MSSRREAPEPWASAMTDGGMVDRGRPSMRQLALRADLSVETVRRMIFGSSAPEVETVDAVADALGKSRAVVSSWIGMQREVDQPWSPPAEAGLLSPKVRAALDQLIRAMTESEATSDGPPKKPGLHAEVLEDTPGARTVQAGYKRQQNPSHVHPHTSGP